MEEQPFLQVIDLYKQFPVAPPIVDRLRRHAQKVVHAVDGVSFSVERGEILGLVGESGSGKTTVGMNILGLQEPTHGRVIFDGNDVSDWSKGRLSNHGENSSTISSLSRRQQILALRRKAQMIFQDPYESINPRQTIFEIVCEPLQIHDLGLDSDQKKEWVRLSMEDCGLKPAEQFWNRFPDGISGGQRQRVVIASALVMEPELLFADEPVSMLDVSIRADILVLLQTLRKTKNISILYTTHDLATAGYFTDRIAVMYLGRIVEIGPTVEVLKEPRHPYTQALVSVAPVPNPRKRRKRLILQGEVPNPIELPEGCRFHPRCPIMSEECKMSDPPYVQISKEHKAACLKI